ncbi:hypothetical protein ASPZODRAFT_168752 [Penicilliopsis zonata CBS 506.65]|uniref:HNH nuclease domain-containing protein n=1 Tax=Penicilliopsis zonata CBS 506.65 TaxID=1073090 RepID=A0A1L9SBD2_9EURO|nr:hypothetical protein ASPZODRAFT_168752 [Penicilliopsis zonata CBS 506.65]OJJ44490.1 hypothetical protein ASPZODRAFT_168752 [Penicilliopsis zonata CBS 506.65]
MDLPPIYIPKKRRAEEISKLEIQRDELEDNLKRTRKKLRAHGSFNAEFWSAAADVESTILKKTRIVSEISLSEFPGDASEWERTEEARRLFEQIRAQKHRVASFQSQSAKLSLSKPRRSLRESFMKLFTTSPVGLGIKTGAGARDGHIQSNFRSGLIRDYQSMHSDGMHAWCPILGDYYPSRAMTAAHIFSYKHGQSTMDSIFGKMRPPQLFSSKNGLLIHSEIEQVLDAGVLVIVPDLPEKPTSAMLCSWTDSEVREFRVRIIDSQWDRLDEGIFGISGLKWRDLDNRKVQFRGTFRPAARFLYFHYCLQVLRRAWRAGPGQKAVFSLTDELGKPFWGTPGRYIAGNMLKAFCEELGHDCDGLMIGASRRRGRRSALLDAATAQIAEKANKMDQNEGEDGDDDEQEEEEEEEEWGRDEIEFIE